jgi:putative transposase
MEDYRRGFHTVYDIKYHLVWVTKYRYRVLAGDVGIRARDLIRQVCQSREVRLSRDT